MNERDEAKKGKNEILHKKLQNEVMLVKQANTDYYQGKVKNFGIVCEI